VSFGLSTNQAEEIPASWRSRLTASRSTSEDSWLAIGRDPTSSLATLALISRSRSKGNHSDSRQRTHTRSGQASQEAWRPLSPCQRLRLQPSLNNPRSSETGTRTGSWKFWTGDAWGRWSADRRVWLSYKSAVNDLTRRIAATTTGLAQAHQAVARSQRGLGWVQQVRPQTLPIDLKRNETGLAAVPHVTIMEKRRREGQDVWTAIATGSVLFTDRRLVFAGPRDVTFEYKDLTDSTLGASGLHLAVSRRKTTHVLAGPAEQLQMTLAACQAVARGDDPVSELRAAERDAVSRVAGRQSELRELNQARKDLGRPSRPFSPAWAPSLALAIGLIGSSGLAATSPPATTSSTTLTAAAVTTSTSVPMTTVVMAQTETATVASVTDGDTIRVLLPDGSNEPVRLIGIDAPEPNQSFGGDAKALLASLVAGQTVRLVPDVSDRDRFGRLLRYVYTGEQFINQKMVESGLAIAREYPPDTINAEVLADAQREAEAAGRGQWSTTTTLPPITPTTIAQTTTTTQAQVTTTTRAPTTTAPPATTTAPPAQNCHSSYTGACLHVGVGDYDCAGGSGNGPNYVQGPVSVVGPDEFDLDRDGDGIGCES
jgi:endonuclease YncB( thermonuclease family)